MPQSGYTTPEQIESMRREIAERKELLIGGVRRGGAGRVLTKKRSAKILGWAVFIVLFALLIDTMVMIQAAKSRGEVPGIFGFHLFSVESGSMEPTLHVGSIIIGRTPAHPEALRKNDIVTFKTRSGYIVTHRIIEVQTDNNGNVSYTTKGDNPINSPDEEPLTPDRVIAVFTAKIPLT